MVVSACNPEAYSQFPSSFHELEKTGWTQPLKATTYCFLPLKFHPVLPMLTATPWVCSSFVVYLWSTHLLCGSGDLVLNKTAVASAVRELSLCPHCFKMYLLFLGHSAHHPVLAEASCLVHVPVCCLCSRARHVQPIACRLCASQDNYEDSSTHL